MVTDDLAKRGERQECRHHGNLVDIHHPDDIGWTSMKIGGYSRESDVRDRRIERGHRKGGENGSGGPSAALNWQTIDCNRTIRRNYIRRHLKALQLSRRSADAGQAAGETLHTAYATGGKILIINRQQDSKCVFNRIYRGDIPHELRV